MAGTGYSGGPTDALSLEFAPNVFGLFGSTHVFNQWTNGRPNVDLEPDTLQEDGVYSDDPKPADTPKVDQKRDGTAPLFMLQDWFDKIHIVPRAKIEFGSIITDVTNTFEIYSAFRTRGQTATLSTVTNNVAPGVTLPDTVAPITLDPMSSILRGTTTGNGAGTGLGTIELTRVIAETQGLAFFDSNVLFDFGSPGNDVQLLLSGQRIVLIPFEYEAPLREVLQFLTNVIETKNGKEQRISLRRSPRQIFSTVYRLSDTERQRMQMLLFDWQAKLFGLPLWHEVVKLTSPVSSGATSLPVSGADEAGFRVGGLVAVIQDNNTFDVVTITSVSSSSIGLGSPVTSSYLAGVSVVPIRTVYIDRSTDGTRYPVTLEDFQMSWISDDNTTGALAGDTTPGFWSIYSPDGRVLMEDCNVISGDQVQVSHPIRLYKLDSLTGKINQDTAWSRSKRVHQKGFLARNRSEIIQLRKLLLALRGKQKSFWIPTFIEDITAADDVTSASALIDIERIEYVRHGQNRSPRNLIRVTLADGTQLTRTITNSTLVNSTTERLTVDSNWGQDIAVEEFERIEFFELVRFDTDSFELNYDRIGQLTLVAPVKSVFDDIV